MRMRPRVLGLRFNLKSAGKPEHICHPHGFLLFHLIPSIPRPNKYRNYKIESREIVYLTSFPSSNLALRFQCIKIELTN